MGFSNSAKAWQGSYGDKSVVSFAIVHGDVHGRHDFECPFSCVPCWVGGIRKDTGLPTRIVHTIGRTNLVSCSKSAACPVSVSKCKPKCSANVQSGRLEEPRVGLWPPCLQCGGIPYLPHINSSHKGMLGTEPQIINNS